MKIQPYIEKLNTSPQFKEFKQKYSDSYLIAGFFVLDFEAGQNLHQIDYYIPKEKKVAAFNLGEGEVEFKILDMLTDKVPEKLNIKTKIDLDALKGILEDEMKNRNMTEEIRKIIAVLQTIEGDKIWNLNCVLSGMEILRAHVEDKSESVLKMERASVMDYIKKVPGQLSKKKPTKEEIDSQLQQLDKLKEALQKEKAAISGKADSISISSKPSKSPKALKSKKK